MSPAEDDMGGFLFICPDSLTIPLPNLTKGAPRIEPVCDFANLRC